MGRKRKKARGGGGAAGSADEAPLLPAAKPPPKIATGLGSLFQQAGVDKAKPKPKAAPRPAPAPPSRTTATPHGARFAADPRTVPAGPVAAAGVAVLDDAAPRSVTELRMLNDAYVGVAKLGAKSQRARIAPLPKVEEGRVRAELAARVKSEDEGARARLDALVAGGVRFKLRRDGEAREFVEGVREGVSPKLLPRVSSKGFAPEATLDLHGVRAAEVPRLIASFIRQHARASAKHVLIITGKGLHSADGTSALRQVAIDALTQGGAAPVVLAFATAHESLGGTGALAVLLE